MQAIWVRNGCPRKMRCITRQHLLFERRNEIRFNRFPISRSSLTFGECFGVSYDFAHNQFDSERKEKKIRATSQKSTFISRRGFCVDYSPLLIRLVGHVGLRHMRWRLRDVDLRRMHLVHCVMGMEHFLSVINFSGLDRLRRDFYTNFNFFSIHKLSLSQFLQNRDDMQMHIMHNPLHNMELKAVEIFFISIFDVVAQSQASLFN